MLTTASVIWTTTATPGSCENSVAIRLQAPRHHLNVPLERVERAVHREAVHEIEHHGWIWIFSRRAERRCTPASSRRLGTKTQRRLADRGRVLATDTPARSDRLDTHARVIPRAAETTARSEP